MGDSTTIEWVGENGKTFNPWIGCEKISAGCKNCYASVDTYARVSASRGLPLWGSGSTRHRTSTANWKKPLAWNKRAKMSREITEHLLRTEGRALPHDRPRVFCASLADVFEGGRPELDAWRADLWRLIEQCDELDWLLLTKQPENVRKMVPWEWIGRGACEECKGNGYAFGEALCGHCPGCNGEDFARAPKWPSYVWLGTTVENQAMADERIPHLLRVPASVRFVSIEPLLGPVDLTATPAGDVLCRCAGCMTMTPDARISWVIVGGESGPGARPMHPDWVRSIRDQCVAAGVPFFFKQWGEWVQEEQAPIDTVLPSTSYTFPKLKGDFWKAGKKAAGRELDGRSWDEVPNG